MLIKHINMEYMTMNQGLFMKLGELLFKYFAAESFVFPVVLENVYL